MLRKTSKQQEFAKESRDLLVLRPGDWKVPAHHEGSYPDSLFIVTGDHSYDMSAVLGKTSLMKRDANLRERHSPVLFFHHPEIDQSLFGENTIGGHMNILPTIFELIAPKDFTYYSLMTSLMDPIDHVVSPYHWLRKDAYGTYSNDFYQLRGRLWTAGSSGRPSAVP